MLKRVSNFFEKQGLLPTMQKFKWYLREDVSRPFLLGDLRVIIERYIKFSDSQWNV